jgi:hypothetical protein
LKVLFSRASELLQPPESNINPTAPACNTATPDAITTPLFTDFILNDLHSEFIKKFFKLSQIPARPKKPPEKTIYEHLRVFQKKSDKFRKNFPPAKADGSLKASVWKKAAGCQQAGHWRGKTAEQ